MLAYVILQKKSSVIYLRDHPEVREEKSFKKFKEIIIQTFQPEEPKLIKL